MGNGNIHPTRIFKEPDQLWEAFEAYRRHLKKEAKEWPKVQYVGKDGERKVDYPVLPYTMEGFECFCYEIYGCIEQYFKNQDNLYTDFIPVCSRIKTEIRSKQITGGLLGAYNASITQRLNGLAEKQQTENLNRTTDNPFKWEEIEGSKEDDAPISK